MKRITQQEYWKEVNELANSGEDIYEVVAGHEWSIYNFYHSFILQFTDNEDAFLDAVDKEFIGEKAMDEGAAGLMQLIAVHAFIQDVLDMVEETCE